MRTCGRGAAILFAVLCMIVPAVVTCQETATDAKRSHPVRLAWSLGPDDVLLPITSVEWGVPDRWSFTARYVHMFTRDRDHQPRLDNLTIALIPGTDGGRLTVGYQGIFKVPGMKEASCFIEPRAVLLRTWGNPLATEPNLTFAGAEVRAAWAPLACLGIGYYRQISSPEGRTDSFWGVHFGFGI